jgi:hypothetical protein
MQSASKSNLQWGQSALFASLVIHTQKSWDSQNNNSENKQTGPVLGLDMGTYKKTIKTNTLPKPKTS